jgi:hypothetical protein
MGSAARPTRGQPTAYIARDLGVGRSYLQKPDITEQGFKAPSPVHVHLDIRVMSLDANTAAQTGLLMTVGKTDLR